MSRLAWKSSTISSVEPPPMSTTSVPGCRLDAASRQLRLFVAADEPGREAVAPFHLAEERFAVLRIAHGTRRNGERSLRAESLERAAVVGERVANTSDRHGEEAAAGVDAFAEPRDARLTVHLVDASVLDVGDEQARRVRAEIDRGDSHLRGYRPATRRTGPVASSSASRRTAKRASETRSLVRASSRFVSVGRPGRRVHHPLQGVRRLSSSLPRWRRKRLNVRQPWRIRTPRNPSDPSTASTLTISASQIVQVMKNTVSAVLQSPRDAGWSSQVARRAHNPEVAGSNPAPAISEAPETGPLCCRSGDRLAKLLRDFRPAHDGPPLRYLE